MIFVDGREARWWDQRVRFLVSRAEAHLEERSDVLRHKACAATLLRDAGCLLLLREQFGGGREFLAQAGEQLLEMELAAGLVLVALDDAGRGRVRLRSYRESVEDAVRRGADAKVDSAEDRRESVAAEARGSFASMFSVVQAGMVEGVADVDSERASERRDSERRELLERHGAREVGGTGMSVFRYLGVAASMEAGALGVTDDATGYVVRAVELLGRRREERIEAARRDEFNWRHVGRPAELLDLDSVVLMQVALAAGYDEKLLREWTGWQKGDVVGAPLDVAVHLRGS